MFILKSGNYKLYVTPVVAVIEIVIISFLEHAIPSVAGDGLDFIDSLTVSFLVLTGSLGSLFLHEYAHSITARLMHLSVNGISVSLFGAYMSIGSEPSTPKASFIISAAGPLANIFAGIIFYAGCLAFGETGIASAVCFCLSVFNGIFSAYNLLPVMPLDGGIIVRSAFWGSSSNFYWASQVSFNIGTVFTLICFITGLINIFACHPVIGLIFFFLGVSLRQTEKSAYRQMMAARFLGSLSTGNRWQADCH